MACVLSSTAATLSVLAMFLRFCGTRVRTMDSLCENAYGIYLVHYLFVIWLQYLLLRAPLAALALRWRTSECGQTANSAGLGR
jgi:hypothetical protein